MASTKKTMRQADLRDPTGSLHGAGAYGNWHRHYFPLVDYKDKYRLVIAIAASSVVPNSNPPTVTISALQGRTRGGRCGANRQGAH